ncbi:MAG TPA: PEP/pyruvate-binding domain-containing protein, partial [Methanolinea sp.]|nr:PEP/pyruvate-binding domain-containing protein [Methanolinea sp.]
MKKMPDILWLEEIRKEDIAAVGGKGASLGEMSAIGLPVPRAFVVTSNAFRRFLIESGIEKALFAGLANLDVEDSGELEKAANKAKELVMKARVPASIKQKVKEAYLKMEGGLMVVAVRSSATAEDLPDASFAGQQETFLNVKGEKNLLLAMQKCWASLYGARAIYYRVKQGFDHQSVNIAVVVQQLVNAEKAGVMFTSHPVTGEPLSIIEGSWGLGEAVVSGSVSPDKYVYDQRSEKVIDRLIANKRYQILSDGDNGTKTVEVERERQDTPLLSDEEVRKL